MLNADDPRVAAMAGRTVARVVRYGLARTLTGPDDLRGSDVEVRADGIRLQAHFHGLAHPLWLPLVGAHHAYTAWPPRRWEYATG